MSQRVWPVVLGLAVAGGCSGPSKADHCDSESDCGAGELCARDGACWPQSEVRDARVTWTLRSQPATAQSCANSPQLDINFFSATASFGFSPVTCVVGTFFIDKLPLAYSRVELVRLGEMRSAVSAQFNASGSAAIDLPY